MSRQRENIAQVIDGALHDGTGLGWDDTFYLSRPTSVNAAMGYGPIFLGGAEIIYLMRAYPNVAATNIADDITANR